MSHIYQQKLLIKNTWGRFPSAYMDARGECSKTRLSHQRLFHQNTHTQTHAHTTTAGLDHQVKPDFHITTDKPWESEPKNLPFSPINFKTSGFKILQTNCETGYIPVELRWLTCHRARRWTQLCTLAPPPNFKHHLPLWLWLHSRGQMSVCLQQTRRALRKLFEAGRTCFNHRIPPKTKSKQRVMSKDPRPGQTSQLAVTTAALKECIRRVNSGEIADSQGC